MESYELGVSLLWRQKDDLYNWFSVEKYDCYCPGPDSDDGNLRLYRSSFDIEDDEELLFVRDTSMDWKDEGVVITSRAIHIILDNSTHEINNIKWTELEHVEYSNGYFYIYRNNNSPHILSEKYFFKKDPHISAYKKLCAYLTEIAHFSKFDELFLKSDYKNALQIIKTLVRANNDELFFHLHYGMCIYKYEIYQKASPDKAELNKALEEINNALDEYDYPGIHEYLAAIYEKLGNLWAARNHYLLYMDDEDNFQDGMNDLIELEDNSEEMNNYIDYEYKSRKLLMPIDDHRIAGCVAGGIDVFRMSNIPSCIKFPVGHPVSGQLYIGHPFKPELYVPYETYEETFFVDKVHELCHLLQCLGATEITIESVKGRNVSELYNDSFSVNGDVGIKAFSGSGSYDSNYSSDRSGTSHSRRAMHFSFDPMYKPYVPEGLVWYPESTEWQRLVQNRLHGNMLEYSEHLSTSQTRIINSTEQEKVKASARILWAKANVNVEKSSNNSFKESIETEWKVSVTFRSIREMNGCDEHQSDNEYDSNDLDIESLMDAAEQGDAVAQYNLGVSYRDGKGIQQDYKKAFDWFKKSAEQGYAAAQFEIGFCYRTGKGIQQDYKKAFEWFKKSAEQGYATAQFCLGLCYSYGRGVQENYKKAFEWFEKSVEQGIFLAQRELGILYAQGLGVKQDDSKAVELYRKAAEQGDSVALNNLGYMYEHGRGVPQSYEEAFKLYSKAAKGKGNVSKSIWHLGDFYENGKGVQKDYNKALDLYKQAFDKGYKDAQKDIDRVTAILNGGNTTSGTTDSANEQEYIETLKEIIAEDGEITDRERRLLEKLRTKLGISESRAKELENALANPSLTAEEQEYLNEYKSIAADGEITDKERKLLDKIRKMSGISEKRAREIEKMA